MSTSNYPSKASFYMNECDYLNRDDALAVYSKAVDPGQNVVLKAKCLYPLVLAGETKPWYVTVPRLFSSEQCSQLVSIADRHIEAGEYWPDGYGAADAKPVDITFLDCAEADWAYDCVASAFQRSNLWSVHLTGIYHRFRMMRYPQGSFRTAHVDYNYRRGESLKLTLVALLAPTTSFEGGDLCIMQETIRLEQGDAVIFPSIAIHEVKPLVNGTRYSLGAWAAGPELI